MSARTVLVDDKPHSGATAHQGQNFDQQVFFGGRDHGPSFPIEAGIGLVADQQLQVVPLEVVFRSWHSIPVIKMRVI